MDVFEFMLQRLVAHHLESHFGGKGMRRIRFRRLSELADEAVLLISAFAHLNPDPADSFKQACDGLEIPGGTLLESNRISLNEISGALERFETSSPLVKKEALQACVRAVASDGELSCLLYTSPSPRDLSTSRMPSSA